MSKLKVFQGKHLLYRKMSLTEYEGLIKNGFQIIVGAKNDYRKWLSDSLVAAARFKNPYFNEVEVIAKAHINYDFFKYVAINGIVFDKNQRHLFFQNEAILQNDLIYCPAHIATSEYINYGVSRKALEVLNSNITQIDQINLSNFSEDLMRELYGIPDFQSLVTGDSTLSNLEFFIQMPSDLAILSLKHNCIFTEGLNSIIKHRFLSDNVDIIDKLNGGRLPALLKVKFKPIFLDSKYYYQFKNNGVAGLQTNDIIAVNEMIDEISIVKIDENRNGYNTPKRYIGNNSYKIHEPKPLDLYHLKSLSIEEIEKLKAILNTDINISELIRIVPPFKNCIDCGQINPAHIYDVSNHIILSIHAIEDIISILSSANQIFKVNEKELSRMKIAMLFHDIGKPYCDITNAVDKYTQFREYMEKSLAIADVLLENIEDKELVLNLIKMSKTNGFKTQNNYFSNIIKILKEKGLNPEAIIIEANKIVYQTFILKLANFSTMQREKFHSNFRLCLDMLINWEEYKKKRLNVSNPLETDLCELENLYSELLENIVIGSTNSDREESNNEPIPILNLILNMRFENSSVSNDYELKSNKYKNYTSYKQLELSEIIDMINNSEDSDLLFDKIRSVRYDLLTGDKIHGIPHNEKVALFSFIMGIIYECNREELDILLEAAYYHDIGRTVERSETLHGKKSAEIYAAENLCKYNRKERIIRFIIEGHSLNDSDLNDLIKDYHLEEVEEIAMKLIRILKDSDALDLVRLTINSPTSKLNPDLLRNSVALNMLKLTHQINEVYYKQFKKIAESRTEHQKKLI